MKNIQFAEQLTYRRKQKGFSQEQLADKTKVTVRTIQRIEKGEVTPHLRTVKLLAAALDIEVDDLLQLDNPREENVRVKWLLLMHSTPFIGFVLPFFNILCPLFLWIHKREDNPLYDEHGRAVINFQINVTVIYLIAITALLSIEHYGFLFFIAVLPCTAIIMLVNVVSILRSQKYYYPSVSLVRKLVKPKHI